MNARLWPLVTTVILLFSVSATAEDQTADFSRTPVLFVHGYFVTANAGGATWANFKNQMIKEGWPEEYLFNPSFDEVQGCDPGHAMEIDAWVDDIIDKTGFDKVDIVCHSGGCLNTAWYLRFFCGVNKVRNFIGLAGAVHGTVVACVDWWSCGADEMCIGLGDDGWKENPLLVAVNECDETLGDVLYTSIWSDYDEIIRPPEGSELAGAHNIEVETPMVEHGGIFLAEEPYALMTNALLNSTGKNEDGPGWHCIPDCAPPSDPAPELLTGDIAVGDDLGSSDDAVESAEVADFTDDTAETPDADPLVPDWRPDSAGLVAIDPGPQDDGSSSILGEDSSVISTPTGDGGCSAGHKTHAESAIFVFLAFLFLILLRRRLDGGRS